MIRVLLVDDSAVVRRLVTNALNRDPALQVVGTAANGELALQQLEELRPDVVVLDLEMPVMDGLQTLVELRKTHPCLPVIMFSRFTQRGVEATVHALTLGADDYVPKPGDGLDVDACIGEQLIPKIKLLAQRRSKSEPLAQVAPASNWRSDAAPISAARKPIEVVVIGVSTGGPGALTEVVAGIPSDFGVPILIVQHMPAEFTARLAERLDEKSSVKVREAARGELISAAQVWIAAGGFHLGVRQSAGHVTLELNEDPPENSCRPSVDVLFRSAVEHYGAAVLGVVMTGMGRDGLRGCQSIRSAGGQVIVQDEATSVVWSMPGAVAQDGLAEEILPLDRLAAAIQARCRQRA